MLRQASLPSQDFAKFGKMVKLISFAPFQQVVRSTPNKEREANQSVGVLHKHWKMPMRSVRE